MPGLTSTLNVDEGGVRLVMLAAMGTMLGVALAVPGAFGDDAALFGFAFLVVRVLHLVLYANVARSDPDLLAALLRVVPTELLGAVLLVVAAFVGGDARIAIWMLALAIDYVGPAVVALR
jgi:low temperature requirement protein LtrA